jgi:1,2-diacylglycerol 3-beta-galactosyltransferase
LSKKRVLLLTVEAGFGHLYAAKAIAAAVDEKYGDSCQTEIVNVFDDKHVPLFLRRTQDDYDKVVREWPEIYKLGYQATDGLLRGSIFENSLMVLLYEAVRRVYKTYRPDVVVTTFPFFQAPLGAYFTLKNHYTPLITVVTDLVTIHFTWYHRAADFCLVPTARAAELAIEYGLSPETIKITGIPVHPLFAEKQDKKAIRTKLGLDLERTTVLAVGSKRIDVLPKYLEPLNHSGFPLQFIAVAGGSETLYRDLKSIDWHHPAKVYNFVDNMPELMHAADCMISKPGGLTVTESLASGLPMLLVEAIPGQETGNQEYVVEKQAGAYIEKPLRMLETISHWLANDGAMLHTCAENAARLGRPRAAYEVADLVWEAVQHGPYVRTNRYPLGVKKIKETLGGFGILTDERNTGSLG